MVLGIRAVVADAGGEENRRVTVMEHRRIGGGETRNILYLCNGASYIGVLVTILIVKIHELYI